MSGDSKQIRRSRPDLCTAAVLPMRRIARGLEGSPPEAAQLSPAADISRMSGNAGRCSFGSLRKLTPPATASALPRFNQAG